MMQLRKSTFEDTDDVYVKVDKIKKDNKEIIKRMNFICDKILKLKKERV